jgi:hypothetical protein
MTAVAPVAQPSSTAARPSRGGAIVAWGAWAIMTLGALALVYHYGVNVPTWDDWDMVPTLTGHQPVTWQWLWSQHNEHRVPLPRLIMLAVMKPFGPDFRGGMYFNVFSAALLAAVLMLVARRLRDTHRTRWADAFFPVLLLNWAQGLNFLWGWQVEFFTSTLLAGGALAAAAWGPRLTRGAAVTLFACLALAAMCGAHGIALLPAMIVYFILIAAIRWRSAPHGGAERQHHPAPPLVLPITLAILLLALIAFYMYGYHAVPWHPKRIAISAMLITWLQFLTMSFGSAIRPAWPVTGILMALLAVGTAWLLIVTFRRRPDQRERIAGIFFFCGAMVTLAVGIGMSRDGLEPRYITLAVPIAAAAYLAWEAYGRDAHPKWGARVPIALFITTLLALPLNMKEGRAYARELSGNLYAIRDRIAHGTPPSALYARYAIWLHPHAEVVSDYLAMLRDARVWPYKRLAPEPSFREVPVPLEPVLVQAATWDRSRRMITSDTTWPTVRFVLPDNPRVAGIRLRYRHHNLNGRYPFVFLRYRKPGQGAFPPSQFQKYSPTGDHANWLRGSYARLGDDYSTMHTWIYDKIDMIELLPDGQPCEFELLELTLLEPQDKASTTRP